MVALAHTIQMRVSKNKAAIYQIANGRGLKIDTCNFILEYVSSCIHASYALLLLYYVISTRLKVPCELQVWQSFVFMYMYIDPSTMK